MAFDATAGGASANSYATVAEADAYLAVRGDTSTWTALTQTQKENKLQWAAIVMDTLTFRGIKAASTQALECPRAGVVDRNGYPVSSVTVPSAIKNAQAEMAFQLIANDWTQGLGPITQDSLKVGSLEFGRKSHKSIPAAVVAMLQPFLAVTPGSGGRLVRG